jgi:hypothetical protein
VEDKMYKATQNSNEFFQKTGNYSTHSARTGKNLLGWGDNTQEILTLDQEREIILLAIKAKEEKKKDTLRGSFEYQTLTIELIELANKMSEIRKALNIKNNDVGHFIIEIFKERVTILEWERIVDEARHRAKLFEDKLNYLEENK